MSCTITKQVHVDFDYSLAFEKYYNYKTVKRLHHTLLANFFTVHEVTTPKLDQMFNWMENLRLALFYPYILLLMIIICNINFFQQKVFYNIILTSDHRRYQIQFAAAQREIWYHNHPQRSLRRSRRRGEYQIAVK